MTVILCNSLGNVIGSIPWSSEEASNITVENQDTVVYPHPVAKSLAIRGKASEFSNRMQILSSTQGRHAPLRLAMEKRIMNRIQPRLPGLYSHHPLAAQLDGRLDDIDIADFINRRPFYKFLFKQFYYFIRIFRNKA